LPGAMPVKVARYTRSEGTRLSILSFQKTFDISGEHTVARILWNKHVYAESVEYPVSSLVQHTQIFTISVAVNY
jgi:hypothetical protein